MKKAICYIFFSLVIFSINAQRLDKQYGLQMFKSLYNGKVYDFFIPYNTWIEIEPGYDSCISFKPMFPYESIDGLFFIYNALNIAKTRHLNILLLPNTNASDFFEDYYFDSAYCVDDEYIKKTRLFVSYDSLMRPIQESFYLDNNENNLRFYTKHNYGQEDTDTLYTYLDIRLNYLYQKYPITNFAIYRCNYNFRYGRSLGIIYPSDTVLLTTSIYKKGKLISLHHDYLEQYMRIYHAQRYLYDFETDYIPIVPNINFTYRVFYNDDGSIEKITAPIISFEEEVYSGIFMNVTYPIQTAEYNFEYKYLWGGNKLEMTITSPKIVSDLKNCTYNLNKKYFEKKYVLHKKVRNN
jgi:hypothetical protein